MFTVESIADIHVNGLCFHPYKSIPPILFFPSRDSLGGASRTMPLTPAQGRETV